MRVSSCTAIKPRRGREGQMAGWDPAEHFVGVYLCHCLFRFNETLMFLVTSRGLGCLSLCVYEHEKISSSKNGSFCSEFHMVHRQDETDQKKRKKEKVRGSDVSIPEPAFLSWGSHSPTPLYSQSLLHFLCQLTGSISDNRCLTKKEK